MIFIVQPALQIDGYKLDHRRQYPSKTQMVYSNFTPRQSRTGAKAVVNFGLQYFIKEYLIRQWNENFFKQPVEKIAQAYRRRVSRYLGVPDFPVEHIEALHALGYLPVEIKALPEGALVPMQVPQFTIFSTHDDFGWLTNYLETIASCITWGPTTSATTAFEFMKRLTAYALKTVGNADFVPYQAHDFSFRGMFGMEAALMSGGAHLATGFYGTDTIPAIDWLEEYYGADADKETVGVSVPATEHSVMCAGGDINELQTFQRLLTEVYPTGILSVVSDTWDYYGVLTKILPQLKELIMKRDGKLVIRPDSGDSVKVICGYRVHETDVTPNAQKLQILGAQGIDVLVIGDDGVYEIFHTPDRGYAMRPTHLTEPEIKGTIEILWDLFGGTESIHGYKMLDPHIGCILGDGVTIEKLDDILARLEEKGFASTNMVFGVGSFTYQYVTRDTYGMAMKATFCRINDVEHAIFKNPRTVNPGFSKKSAKGLLSVRLDEEGNYYLKDNCTWEEEAESELQPVFRNSQLLHETTLGEVRERVASRLLKKVNRLWQIRMRDDFHVSGVSTGRIRSSGEPNETTTPR